MKDKKACIFYFLMTLIFLDFGNQLKILSQNPYFKNINNPLFKIENVTNTGSAFGLFSNFSNGKYILAAFGIIVVIILSYYVYKNISFKDKLPLLSLILFSAGTLGNVVERIRYGMVFDYIKLNFIDFPVFNSFDCFICTGVFIYFIFLVFEARTNDN